MSFPARLGDWNVWDWDIWNRDVFMKSASVIQINKSQYFPTPLKLVAEGEGGRSAEREECCPHRLLMCASPALSAGRGA